MSSQLNKWKEEQILIICPGSHTTMAQLGCNELTPPVFRVPTRMFRDDETGEWRPYRTFKRKKQQKKPAQLQITANGENGTEDTKEEDEWEYVEDPESDEGAVYPMQGGYIVHMDAFLAFLEHVHGLLTTTYHNTPIVLMTSAQWTRPDCEAIALYIFEKTRTPALCMINSALATQYGLKWPHMTVIDIGFEKVDVTCIYDSRVVNHLGVGYAGEPGDDRAISGGEVFTQRLRSLLRDKNFSHEMAEQLKKSNICEVLPYAPEFPALMELPKDDASTAAAATAGPAAVLSAAAGTDDPLATGAPAATAPVVDSAATTDDAEDGAVPVAEDGVLDVASIVTSGQTKEFLAKKEKERSERGRFGRRGKDREAAEVAARPVRLPNSKRARMTFHFEELVEEEEQEEPEQQQQTPKSTSNGTAGVNGKNHHAEEHDGSEDGSEGEGSEMDEDEDEEGEGDDANAGGAAKAEKASTADAATSADKEAVKPTEESAAPATAVKDESTPSVATPAPEADKPAEEKPKEEAAAPSTADAAEKPKEPEAPAAASDAAPATTSDDKPSTPKAATEDATMEDAPAAPKEETTDAAAKPAETPAQATSTEMVLATPTPAAPVVVEEAPVAVVEEFKGPRYKRLRRDFEIGLERFTFADRYEIDRIVSTIYRAVQGIEEMYMRPACWENLVFVGNGCRLRGLRENILQTLNARHLISPSTATMFTSELPSNMGTPSGTGSQTPTGSFNTPPHQLPTSSSVNPLLQAATTGNLPPGSVTGGPGSVAGGDAGHSHHFHSQTPTTIKLATLPTYLGEWTKNGFEEAMFLGAQVAARLAFCVHNLDAAGLESQRQMSLTRVDYNELGPKGIRTHAMLG
ncbi:Actin-like protein arp9 [Sporothrix stenoceras]|uniref:Actin-like protein arp9 n=1 Tax=Sporothrix stenoceras TaxID=5173 RepID=A0ABR3YXS2_9PEZI